MGYAKTRKLNLLAFTKLLECNQKWILIRLHDLMTVWTDVVTESDNAQESAEFALPLSIPSIVLNLTTQSKKKLC